MDDHADESFYVSGPVHITSPDWENPDHKRIIVASLVKGVSILECDRQKNRSDSQAYAPPWWSTFQFRLYEVLEDDKDKSIFGAIYEFNDSAAHYNAPKFVVAFRGTLLKTDTICGDFGRDFKIIRGELHKTSCSQRAMQAVQGIVSREGANNVLLAGHSLGSAIALLTGKNMAKKDYFIKTYLFNPPFPSAPIDFIHNPKLKKGILDASSIVKALFSLIAKDNSFSVLSGWLPQLFVNRADPICCGYAGYFEHRRRMEAKGAVAAMIERRAAQISIRSTIRRWRGKDSEPLHLLPSAYLTINNGTQVKGISAVPCTELHKFCKQSLKAHGIRQWWDPDFRGGQPELHEFSEESFSWQLTWCECLPFRN